MQLVATLIANPGKTSLSASHVETAKQVLGSTASKWLDEGIACDVMVPAALPLDEAKARLAAAISGMAIDVCVQPQAKRRKKALIADMDSTMIGQECIDELADHAGFGAAVARITARAMNGDIAFEPALRERVALLRDLPVAAIEQVLADRITDAPGAKTLVATMRSAGAYCALVSGGFTVFARAIAKRQGFDEYRANALLENNGALTGEVAEPILGKDAKKEALLDIARVRGLQPAEFIAVGDGANDLAMLALAGTGIALHAKPAVAAQADIRIDHGDLTALLYVQGYHRRDFAA